MSPSEDPLDVLTSVEYQASSIVSRIIQKTPGGSVTVFAFDKGQELSEHTSPAQALIQVVDGEASVRIGGADHRVCSGQIISLPANIPHAVSAHQRFKMVLTMLKP